MKYAQLVRELVIRRHALGLTQAEVAEAMGVRTPQHLGKLEGMQAHARQPTLERWCDALGVNLHYKLIVRKRMGRPYKNGHG